MLRENLYSSDREMDHTCPHSGYYTNVSKSHSLIKKKYYNLLWCLSKDGFIKFYVQLHLYWNWLKLDNMEGPSWPWSYGNWIYNCLCNRCLSPLMMSVRTLIRVRCTTLCDKVCQWLVTGLWFSPGPAVSSTNKTDRHDIAEILLKVALNIIKQTKHW